MRTLQVTANKEMVGRELAIAGFSIAVAIRSLDLVIHSLDSTLLQHRDLEIAPRRRNGLIAPYSSYGTPLECID